MRHVFRLLVAALVFGVLAAPASAQSDQVLRMERLFDSPNQATNSDFAFWGHHAFSGYYRSEAVSQGGVRIFDISDPASPDLARRVRLVLERSGGMFVKFGQIAATRTDLLPATITDELSKLHADVARVPADHRREQREDPEAGDREDVRVSRDHAR